MASHRPGNIVDCGSQIIEQKKDRLRTKKEKCTKENKKECCCCSS
jgi:hypothetical protein